MGKLLICVGKLKETFFTTHLNLISSCALFKLTTLPPSHPLSVGLALLLHVQLGNYILHPFSVGVIYVDVNKLAT